MNEIFNHLWQSAAFTVLIWLAAVALRQNSPRLRYWLWFAASVKLLIPFSLLVSTGARMPLPPATLSSNGATVAQISAYFEPVPEVPAKVSSRSAFPWTAAFAAIWLIGATFLLLRWFRRWLSIRRAVQQAIRLPIVHPIPVFSAPAMMEPGVFGLFRPVLLLPEGIANRLTPKQLKAILAHELRHIECFDNLTAAVHMGVETLFWFNPLVWWIGAKLMSERERDCDEVVLRQGNERGDYARGIVYVCETYVQSPLPCAPGIGGSDLKGRVREIMLWRGSLPVTLHLKAILAAAAIAVMTIPLAIGVMRAQTAPPSAARPTENAAAGSLQKATHAEFEVASVKPGAPLQQGEQIVMNLGTARNGRVTLTNATLGDCIKYAYGLISDEQISGPDWVKSKEVRFNIIAQAPPATPQDQLLGMLQTLLAKRVKLVFHHEERPLSYLALVVGKAGSKMSEATAGSNPPSVGQGHIYHNRISMSVLATLLSRFERALILDRTDLPGFYTVKLDWTSERLRGGGGPPSPNGAAIDPDGPALATALQEQLGLRLDSRKGPVDIFVIDHAEKVPTEN